MQIIISLPGMIAGTVFGAIIRYALSFSEIYHPGWFWWYQQGLHVPPGTAGFTGYTDPRLLAGNELNVGFCLVVCLLPGFIGGAIGAMAGASGRIVRGAMIGGLFSGIVQLLMRLPELYRPGWYGSPWIDDNVPILAESIVVGALVGAVAGGIGKLARRLRSGG